MGSSLKSLNIVTKFFWWYAFMSFIEVDNGFFALGLEEIITKKDLKDRIKLLLNLPHFFRQAQNECDIFEII
jgi:hypothetical protein